jgi:hypothetical protein
MWIRKHIAKYAAVMLALFALGGVAAEPVLAASGSATANYKVKKPGKGNNGKHKGQNKNGNKGKHNGQHKKHKKKKKKKKH